jgi:hypothetical protein
MPASRCPRERFFRLRLKKVGMMSETASDLAIGRSAVSVGRTLSP